MSTDSQGLTAQHRAIQRVVDVLRADPARPISLPEMAEIAHYSAAYFNQLFCATVGVPPSRYLSALRVEAAKRLLVNSNLRVGDICCEVGYRSFGTFSSRFTELVGISPHAFRALSNATPWPDPERLVGLSEHSFHPMFRSHKQAAVGTIQVVSDDGTSGLATGPMPVFIGLYRHPIPQGEPVAHTITVGSPTYTLPAVPDGRYHVFATSFPWSEDPRANLLLDSHHPHLLVAGGPLPLCVRNGRIRNRVGLSMRSVRPTDPPLLTALPHLLLRSRKTPFTPRG